MFETIINGGSGMENVGGEDRNKNEHYNPFSFRDTPFGGFGTHFGTPRTQFLGNQ